MKRLFLSSYLDYFCRPVETRIFLRNIMFRYIYLVCFIYGKRCLKVLSKNTEKQILSGMLFLRDYINFRTQQKWGNLAPYILSLILRREVWCLKTLPVIIGAAVVLCSFFVRLASWRTNELVKTSWSNTNSISWAKVRNGKANRIFTQTTSSNSILIHQFNVTWTLPYLKGLNSWQT